MAEEVLVLDLDDSQFQARLAAFKSRSAEISQTLGLELKKVNISAGKLTAEFMKVGAAAGRAGQQGAQAQRQMGAAAKEAQQSLAAEVQFIRQLGEAKRQQSQQAKVAQLQQAQEFDNRIDAISQEIKFLRQLGTERRKAAQAPPGVAIPRFRQPGVDPLTVPLAERTRQLRRVKLQSESLAQTNQRLAKQTDTVARRFVEAGRSTTAHGRAIGGTADVTSRAVFAFQQLSFGVQDFSAVVGSTGLAGGIRAANNNLTQMLAILNPMAGVIGGIAIGIGGTLLANLLDANRASKDLADEGMAKIQERAEKLKESFRESGEAIRDLQDEMDRLRFGGEVSSILQSRRERAAKLGAAAADVSEAEDLRRKTFAAVVRELQKRFNIDFRAAQERAKRFVEGPEKEIPVRQLTRREVEKIQEARAARRDFREAEIRQSDLEKQARRVEQAERQDIRERLLAPFDADTIAELQKKGRERLEEFTALKPVLSKKDFEEIGEILVERIQRGAELIRLQEAERAALPEEQAKRLQRQLEAEKKGLTFQRSERERALAAEMIEARKPAHRDLTPREKERQRSEARRQAKEEFDPMLEPIVSALAELDARLAFFGAAQDTPQKTDDKESQKLLKETVNRLDRIVKALERPGQKSRVGNN